MEDFSETQDFKIATLGNVDSGKSTLVGCLAKGLLDDGNGKARATVLKFAHERVRGQTSAATTQLIGYRNGEQIISGKKQLRNKETHDIAVKATHRLTLVDLCGHEKYLKTTIYGLTGLKPDCALVVVGAERGIQKMTREHIGLCCALRIPFFIVTTKIDSCPQQIFKETQMKIKRILKRAGRKYFLAQDVQHCEEAANCMFGSIEGSFAPVFEVSCVTGQGLDVLKQFLGQVVSRNVKVIQDSSADVLMRLEDVYNVEGIGIVLSGSLITGEIQAGQHLFVGPSKIGDFREIAVRSIYRQCVPSAVACAGQHCTIGIKPTGRGKENLKKDMFRKGSVLVSGIDLALAHTVMEFEADIRVLHHSTTIEVGYTPMLHIGSVRQSARVLHIADSDGEAVVARTGSQVTVRFRFVGGFEFVQPETKLIFREGNAKGCGTVLRVFRDD